MRVIRQFLVPCAKRMACIKVGQVVFLLDIQQERYMLTVDPRYSLIPKLGWR